MEIASTYASSSIAQVDSIDGSLDCTGTGIKLNKDFALFDLGGSIGISSTLVSGDGDGTLFSSAVKMISVDSFFSISSKHHVI